MITVAGEALVDVVSDGSGVGSVHPGGSPANVAVGLARLGAPVTLLTRVGRDADGQKVLAHLTGNGVELPGDTVDGRETSVATARLDTDGVAAYDFDIVWELAPATAVPTGSVCLHIGSLGAYLEPGASAVRRLVEAARGSATVSYDPNCRPALMGRPADARSRIEALVRLADVVKASAEDLTWLYGGQPPVEVARRWLELGPALVTVTLGGDGAFAMATSGAVERPAPRVTVADTVGAGDSFMAALLDGLRRGDLLGGARAAALRAVDGPALTRIIDGSIRAAGITCGRVGANPPTAAELAAPD